MGSGSPDDVMKLYTPACREGKSGDTIRQGAHCQPHGSPRARIPRSKASSSATASPWRRHRTATPSRCLTSRNIRLLVDGTWVTAHDQLVSLDLEQADAEAEPGHLTLEYVDGKLLVASC